ncbi:unnamed protein product, partial [Lymnaea stagnalis]
ISLGQPGPSTSSGLFLVQIPKNKTKTYQDEIFLTAPPRPDGGLHSPRRPDQTPPLRGQPQHPHPRRGQRHRGQHRHHRQPPGTGRHQRRERPRAGDRDQHADRTGRLRGGQDHGHRRGRREPVRRRGEERTGRRHPGPWECGLEFGQLNSQ